MSEGKPNAPYKFTYEALVTKVYDGDTITVDIDLGFGNLMKKKSLRLFGINTPEVRGEERPEGLMSRDWLHQQIMGKKVTIKTIKDKTGKYGRYLAVIFFNGVNLNEELVRLGLAEFKQY